MTAKTKVTLPNNWRPRAHQRKVWDYFEQGGKRAILFWHRRAGKDDVALHHTATQAMQHVGNYWHMLPEQAQARKAIWNAVNKHTGKRRIDEAFPLAIRKRTLDQEMLIEFINGSIWQVVGSDNYNSLVGSPPVGVIFSEWALAKPEAWSYLRPILAENGGWAMFITTPRGKNHAYNMYKGALGDSSWFAELLTADDTGVFTPEQLATERAELIREHGEAVGLALFNQEFNCSVDSAIVGAVFGEEMERAKQQGRIGEIPYRRELPVYTFWDLGFSDATAIWFGQIVGDYIHLIDYYEHSNKDLAHYVGVLNAKDYAYAKDMIPHDGGNKTLLGQPEDVLRRLGRSPQVVPRTPDKLASIDATKRLFQRLRIDQTRCAAGLECLTNYRWEYDKDKGISGRRPLHDWASNGADALQTLGMSAETLESATTNSLRDYHKRVVIERRT